MPSLDLTALCRLTQRATPESLRRNPLTTPYIGRFFFLAKRDGLRVARAWLLGALLLDLHPHTDATPTDLLAHHSHYAPPPESEPTNTPRDRLQQHIESAATHVDLTSTL